MHATTIALAVVTLAAQQAPAQRYAAGQEVRVCGEITAKRTNTSTCEATLQVRSAGEDFEVVIPASVRKGMSLAPERLRGGVACFSGRVAQAPPAVRIQAASVEVTAAPPGASLASEAVVACGGHVTMPQVLKEQKPEYSSEAMRARIQGSVEVEAVVDTEGNITDARVVRALHPDLDEKAVAAVKAWKFSPGLMDGKPVPVLIDIEMSFAMSSRR
jgi:protein TonB